MAIGRHCFRVWHQIRICPIWIYSPWFRFAVWKPPNSQPEALSIALTKPNFTTIQYSYILRHNAQIWTSFEVVSHGTAATFCVQRSLCKYLLYLKMSRIETCVHTEVPPPINIAMSRNKPIDSKTSQELRMLSSWKIICASSQLCIPDFWTIFRVIPSAGWSFQLFAQACSSN